MRSCGGDRGRSTTSRWSRPTPASFHQVNLEYLARVVFGAGGDGDTARAYPDTLVGTDSHTTMVNGLGVLGWGVGGIEAEAAMLGQPMSMLIPQVVGFRLVGELHEGATATDLVLTVTEMLRRTRRGREVRRVLRSGAGQPPACRPRDDREHVARVRRRPARSSRSTPRRSGTWSSSVAAPQIELVEAYAREQGLWHDEDSEEPTFTDRLELDLATVVPSIAGPRRPQDRVSLTESKAAFRMALEDYRGRAAEDEGTRAPRTRRSQSFPASDPVSTHFPNGAGHEPLGEQAAPRLRTGRRPPPRSRSPTAPRPNSITATW